jgi:tyrosine-protein kinase Etk/Wzc
MESIFERETEEKKEKSLIENFLYYVTIVLKYKWFIIITSGVVGVLVAVFLFITLILPPEQSPLPNIYTASILLYVQSEGSTGLESFFYSSYRESPLDTFFSGIDIGEIAIALVYSGSFLDVLVEEMDIPGKYDLEGASKTDYRRILLSKIDAHYDRNRRILVIRCEDINPVFAADLANRIVRHLINWFSEEGGTKKTNLKNTFEEKLVTVTEEISRLETQIQEFQKKYGVLTPNELATAHTSMLNDLNTELIMKELEIKNHSELIKIEDSRLRRLKVERQNILELINQIENGYTGSDRVLPPKSEVPDLLLVFNQLEMSLSIQRNIYQTLLEQYEILKLSAGVDNVFQILEWAEIPEEKSGPSRMMLLVAAVGAVFFLCIAGALVHNYAKKLKKSKKKSKEMII